VKGGAVALLAPHLHAVHGDFAHVPLVHVRQELAEVDFSVFLAIAALLNHLPQQEG